MIKGFLDGLKPVPRLTVSEWADENRVLSPIAAAEHGKWRTSRTPYLKLPMDCLSNYSSYERIYCMKGAQGGWTEMGNNWIGYIIDNSPAPTLMVMPTDGTVERNSKIRIAPMIEACPSLRKKVSDAKSRSGENTITQKNFAGGILLMAGANSPVGLRSMPIKNIFLDEVDGYPLDLNGEGSPIDLAEARTRTFSKRKIFVISTPTIKDVSIIEKEFLATDQNYYNVPCPHCGHYHVLLFDNLKWEEGKPETAKMFCPECGSGIEQKHKTKMLSLGKWIPKCPEKANKKVIGFHWSSFYSPDGWYSWTDIAIAYEKAKNDPNKMKTFVNTVLGETIQESGEAPAWEAIYNRRESYQVGIVPIDVCFLTCGCDVQKDRLELEIVGWCADKSSYSIDFRVLEGNTSLPDVWDKLALVVDEIFKREDGAELQILKTCVDSGYNTSEVHSFCRRYAGGRVIPTKGQASQKMAISPPKQIDINKHGQKIGKVKQWNLGVNILKAELYSWLVLEPNLDGTFPPSYCHFPQYDYNYFEGITAEDYIPASGRWVKRFQRNEPLDCRVYARAASIIVGLDRMKPEQLHAMAGIKKAPDIREPKKEAIKRESFWS